MRARVALGLALVLALSGCAKPDAAPDSAVQQALDAVAGPDPATRLGGIEGVVLTPSLAPLVGARVTLLRENVSVRTDVAGVFRFADLAPAQYLLAAEAEGYHARTVLADARNGSITQLELELAPDPRPAPHHETRELQGFVSCALFVPTPLRDERPDCASADANHRDSFEFPVSGRAKGAVIELVWSVEDNPGATTLRLVVETVGYGANDLELGNVTGEGYARVDVAPDAMDKYYPEGGAMRALVTLAGEGSPQAALQTSFTVYATTFHVEPAPEEFSVVTRSA